MVCRACRYLILCSLQALFSVIIQVSILTLESATERRPERTPKAILREAAPTRQSLQAHARPAILSKHITEKV